MAAGRLFAYEGGREGMLKLGGGELHPQRAVQGMEMLPVSSLTITHTASVTWLIPRAAPVTQTQLLGYVHVMAHGKMHPAGGHTATGYDHGAVMQRGVLEEDVFYQARVYGRVYHVPGLLVIGQGHGALEHYQAPVRLLLRPMQAYTTGNM